MSFIPYLWYSPKTLLLDPCQNLAVVVIQATLYIERLQNGSYTGSSTTLNLGVQLVITDASGATAASPSTTITLDNKRTPIIINATSAADGNGGQLLTVNWQEGQGIGAANSSAGLPSNATLQLQSSARGSAFNCTNATVVTSTLAGTGSTTSYKERLNCSLPAQLPAANYTAWLCHGPSGCGLLANALTVPLTVTAISPTTGSMGGGQTVNITGAGFASNSSEVAVRFGGVPCRVTSAAYDSVVCVMGAAAANASAAVAVSVQALAITPSMVSWAVCGGVGVLDGRGSCEEHSVIFARLAMQ